MRTLKLLLILLCLSSIYVTGAAFQYDAEGQESKPRDIQVTCGNQACPSVGDVIAFATNELITFEVIGASGDGPIVAVEWSFGDGTGTKSDVLKPVSKRYGAPGTYTVGVTVWRKVSPMEIRGSQASVTVLVVKAPYMNDMCMLLGVYPIQIDNFLCSVVNNILGFLIGKFFPATTPRR